MSRRRPTYTPAVPKETQTFTPERIVVISVEHLSKTKAFERAKEQGFIYAMTSWGSKLKCNLIKIKRHKIYTVMGEYTKRNYQKTWGLSVMDFDEK